MSNDRLYEVALGLVPGVGDVLIKHLVSYCGSPEEVFRTTKRRLLKIPGIGVKNAEAIVKSSVLHDAETEIQQIERNGAQILFFTDKDYPSRLKQVYDAPTLLYYKGQDVLNYEKAVGIVGTRKATGYGRDMVTEIVDGLRNFSPLIVSGLAYGIDIHAHRKAMDSNLKTVAVMASGLDTIYPYHHRDSALRMIEQGGILSENRYGTKPEAHLFPARNRIIAGLCDVIIVVEAASRGGALITAEIANNYNREVMAVPGNLSQDHSVGCNALIKRHKAHIYTQMKDLEEIMNWDLDKEDYRSGPSPKRFGPDDFPPEELLVLNLLSENTKGIVLDEISWKTQISITKIASVLLNLEFKGLIRLFPGKKYVIR